jgi:hypothetical protein
MGDFAIRVGARDSAKLVIHSDLSHTRVDSRDL